MTPSSRVASSTREVSSRIRLRARRQTTTTRRTRRRAPGRPPVRDCGLRQTAQKRTRHRVAQRRTRRSALRSRRSLRPTCALRATSLPPHPARASCSYSSPLRPFPPSCHVLERRVLMHSTSVPGPAASFARGPSSRPSRARACPRSTRPRRLPRSAARPTQGATLVRMPAPSASSRARSTRGRAPRAGETGPRRAGRTSRAGRRRPTTRAGRQRALSRPCTSSGRSRSRTRRRKTRRLPRKSPGSRRRGSSGSRRSSRRATGGVGGGGKGRMGARRAGQLGRTTWRATASR